MSADINSLVEANLHAILEELRIQSSVGESFPESQMTFREQMDQLYEYVDDSAEYGIAYEIVVCLLEGYRFTLSGSNAIKLLEIGLLLGFKTERAEDKIFDSRGMPN